MMYSPAQPPKNSTGGQGLKLALIVARFNWHITGAMLDLARTELERQGVDSQDIHVVCVPGSYELAMAAQMLARRQRYDAMICFGCVMQGETRHDVLVGDAAAQGVQRVALDTGIPIIFGVICAETQQQAEARIIRGEECAQAALEMANLAYTLREHESVVVA